VATRITSGSIDRVQRQIQNGKAKHKCKRAGGTPFATQGKPALRNGSCAIECAWEVRCWLRLSAELETKPI
jgi:hypothetical protein